MQLKAGSGKNSRHARHGLALALSCLLALPCAPAAFAGEVYPLSRLEDLAREANPALRAAAAQVDAAKAGVQIARAFPNPEVEYLAGTMRYRPGIAGGISGTADSYGITQPLDLPFRRTPRIEAAKAGLNAAKAGFTAYSADWIAGLRLAYFEALRRTSEKTIAQEDFSLMQSVYSKISLRVKQGDAPRIELIRAEADLLTVQKTAQAAALREEQARLALRAMVGPALPQDFLLAGSLDHGLPLAPPARLFEQALEANPNLARARAEVEQARHRLNYEEAGRLPTIALRAAQDNDREMRQSRIGVTLSIPLWDRKLGAVREAEALSSQAGLRLDAESFAVKQNLDIALRQHQVAQTQVTALENGVVSAAAAAVKVAEAAYKAGERGLIDVLDAQRVYRSARADLVASRYELAAAWVEIQRLVTPASDMISRNN